MEKVITTEDFRYRDRAYSDIPLFIDDDLIPFSVLNNYMLYLVFEQGGVSSSLTWNSYADALIDYFRWLSANNLLWDDEPRPTKYGKEVSNLALYQMWSRREYRKPDGCFLANSTLNQRVSCIRFFYNWAADVVKLINWLPYIPILKARPEQHPDFLAHTHSKQYVESSNLKLPEHKKIPKLLSLDQCREFLAVSMSKTVNIMSRLMLGTGLRNEECREFPRKYIFDPRELDPRKRIRVQLNPIEIPTKGRKERSIYISWQLMADLYEYSQFGQGVERARKYRQQFDVSPSLLFLNESGHPWSKNGLTSAFRKLWAGQEKNGYSYPPALGFKVTPHMLRHTFATFELDCEQKRKGQGHALAWVRDRLGHNSIQTTTIYIHCLDLLDDYELNEYQEELEQMMGENNGS